MRANRQLGTALVEYNLVKLEDLEAANERLLEHVAAGEMRQASLLSVLVYEKKVLKEDEVLHHVVDDHALGVVDLRGYEVPEDIRKDLDPAECWATWSVPFDREEDFHFIATAYYLSTAVRSYWEKRLKGPIVWTATSMENIGDFLEKLQAERDAAAKKAEPVPGGSRPPIPGGSRPPLPEKKAS
jgi:hypothetical protein